MLLIQFINPDSLRKVGIVDGETIKQVKQVSSTRQLALAAIKAELSLVQYLEQLGTDATHNYQLLLEQKRVLAPLDHDDPAHCLVSGTGLTHLGSADTRNKMHEANKVATEVTDSMKMFQWGIEQGRPHTGEVGVQPEWFYKGDGSIVVNPGEAIPVPDFSLDSGEEPELVGLFVIGDDGQPYRLGYAVANELSDHVTERQNYLYLAHSKLRYCSYGPELWVGELPKHLVGQSKIYRNGELLWQKEFLTGEENMSHSLENLEYHQFKYGQFLRPGDVHVHFYGTSTLSFADGIEVQDGDEFEISLHGFPTPLRNKVKRTVTEFKPGDVKPL